MDDLCIPRHILAAIVTQAKAAAPIEACGILAGRGMRVESFHPMINAGHSADHFAMEPKERFAAVKRLRETGQNLLAIYHIHPATPGRRSAEDIRLALTPDVVHVFVSLAGDAPVAKGFLIEGGVVAEISVRVENPAERLALQLPESVRQDVLEYRQKVETFLRGDTSAAAFRAYRVPMGIYEQRASGRYMVRIRIAAGIALPEHLYTIARLSRQYGDGILHVTTRQDIQIHDVAIADTPAVLEGLLEAGLSSRGGGGNTVRNISASLSGVCPTEKFDVGPYAVALAEYLLQHKSSFNLPRKYKIAFSGCDDDCGQASIADLGFFAQIRGGRRGFSVFAGGGMGRLPRPAIRIEDFVAPEDMFEIAEAIRRLFDRHGDRANKHKARLRFVVNRLGEDEFMRLYRSERAALRQEGLPGDVPAIRSADFPEPSASSESIRIRLPLGDIRSDGLFQVAGLAEVEGGGIVRTTQLQDLILPGVPAQNVAGVIERLEALDLVKGAAGAPKIVACAGASMCKLGLCLSRNLANAIVETFRRRGMAIEDVSQVVRISGCPNSCGGHHVAAIGLEGGVRRVEGRLMPVYAVFLNGRLSRDGATLAEKVATVPAKRIPDLLADACVAGRIDPRKLRELAPSFEELPGDIPEVYFYDYGSFEPFSLAGRGPGECGAGVLDVIRVDIDEAHNALNAVASEKDAALYRSLVAAARSLLVVFGIEVKEEREIFREFEQRLVAPGWVSSSANDILAAAIDWRLGDRKSMVEFTSDIAALVKRVEALFLSLDGELKFGLKHVTAVPVHDSRSKTCDCLDLSGEFCQSQSRAGADPCRRDTGGTA